MMLYLTFESYRNWIQCLRILFVWRVNPSYIFVLFAYPLATKMSLCTLFACQNSKSVSCLVLKLRLAGGFCKLEPICNVIIHSSAQLF